MIRSNLKDILLVFFMALIVRIGYIVFFVEMDYLITEDQALYIQLAQEFTSTGFFGVIPERTPGYPLFLALINNIFGENLWAVISTQIVLDSISCVVIALMAKFLFYEKGFWIAGVLSVLNLNMIILSASILTDTLFLFLFILFLFSLLKYLQHKRIEWLLLLVLFLSMATLVRAVSYYLLPILLMVLVIWRLWSRDTILNIATLLLLYITVVGILLGGIHHRNYQQYKSTDFVTQTGSALLWWVIPATYQYSGKGSYREGQAMAVKKLDMALQRDNLLSLPQNPFESSRYEITVGKEMLAELGFINIFKAWLSGSIINLSSPSIAFSPALRSIKHPSFYDSEGIGMMDKIANYIKNSNSFLYVIILAVGTIVSVLFMLLSLIGFLKSTKELPLVINLILLMLVLYFLSVTGPIIGVKYRLPIEPILTLYVTYVLIKWRNITSK